jgi:hypothetical protein
MSGMQNIEHAIGKHDFLLFRAQLFPQLLYL